MSALPRAVDLGVLGCHVCGLVSHDTGGDGLACPRCGVALHRRKHASQSRTWALWLAALILYIPANVLPIMRTVTLGDVQDNTILSGVAQLWRANSPVLAVIVFTASIVVPVMKFLVLATLLIAARRRSDWALRQRASLYRVVEFVGYWSMLDVFVVALLTSLVGFGFLGEIHPMPGVVYFSLMVVLTMLAARSFDPRTTWDGDVFDD